MGNAGFRFIAWSMRRVPSKKDETHLTLMCYTYIRNYTYIFFNNVSINHYGKW